VRPITTERTTGTYGAPPGHDHEVGGLPFYREDVKLSGGTPTTAVCSVWAFSDGERKAIAEGANVLLEIIGREPIPPVSLGLTDQVELFPDKATT
jgi:hypothetical protein